MTHETTAARASLADIGEGTADASQCASINSGAARAGVAEAAPAPFLPNWRDTAEPKSCKRCEEMMRPRSDERPGQWRDRKYCCNQCAAFDRQGNKDAPKTAYLPGWDVPRIIREWPASERFDAPGMEVAPGPGIFVRFNPHMARWI